MYIYPIITSHPLDTYNVVNHTSEKWANKLKHHQTTTKFRNSFCFLFANCERKKANRDFYFLYFSTVLSTELVKVGIPDKQT